MTISRPSSSRPCEAWVTSWACRMTSAQAGKPPLSRKARIMLHVELAFIVCLLVLRLVIENSIEQHFTAQDAMDLQAVVESVEQTLLRYGSQSQESSTALAQTLPLQPGLAFEVRGVNGDLLHSSSRANLAPLLGIGAPVARITPGEPAHPGGIRACLSRRDGPRYRPTGRLCLWPRRSTWSSTTSSWSDCGARSG